MTDIKILNLSQEMQSEALLIPKLCRIEKKHFFESKMTQFSWLFYENQQQNL